MKREIRSSALASMYGVGAVVDVGKESFVIPGTSFWSQQFLRVIELHRLTARLGKSLKAPIAQGGELPVWRFPLAMFCERCHHVVRWRTSYEISGEEPQCQENGCMGKLVAMRFVLACEKGHLEDVPWDRWAHSGHNANPHCLATDQLSFEVDNSTGTAGLASLVVRCKICGSSRSLEEISGKAASKVFGHCGGKHPWIHTREKCKAKPVVLQRGATNLHFPKTISALDVPIQMRVDSLSSWVCQVQADQKYQPLVALLRATTGEIEAVALVYAELIANHVTCPIETVLAIARADAEDQPIIGDSHAAPDFDQETIYNEEWETIQEALSSGGIDSTNFVAQSTSLDHAAPNWLKSLVKHVLLIRKLREVRAYLGFWRVKPGQEANLVKPDIGGVSEWLPATEVFGEGIVISFDFDLLESWFKSLSNLELEQVAMLERKRFDEGYWFLPEVSPSFLALHTIAHLFLRRLTFECGYSASSLRERIYFNPTKRYAGFMIFTAEGDSEGSLGGLVRQGEPDRLARTLLAALETGRWCSADPVCTETAGQGLGGFNRAACHACSLVSETSCTAANTLLDRRMLYAEPWGLLSYLGWQG